ncbi:MAG: hypothetical protein WBV77_16385, partial [Solirubrobacteraceae bacterium]
MSTAIAPTVGVPEDEQAIAQRVQQLQGLIEQTRQVGSGIAPTSATASASTTASQMPAGDFA